MSPRAVVAGAVIAVAWLRLESPADSRAVWAVALALLPLLSPWLALPAALLVMRLAFHAWPNHPLRLVHRFDGGFLDFYDVRTPFDPRIHTEMRGVVLLAIFAFVLALVLAVKRPVVAAAVVLVGAGWPATLAGPRGGFLLGVAILIAVFAVLSRRIQRVAVPVAATVVLGAVAASSAVAQGELVHWQKWDFYNAPAKPVSVSYVWDAQYNGIRFPAKRTTVLEIEAPPRSLFWRAAVLDSFQGDRWVEVAPRRGDSLEPSSGHLLAQHVQVEALSDTRLVGASVPVSFDAGDAPIKTPAPGFASLPSGLSRGFTYSVRSLAPHPTSAALARSSAQYPPALDTFREVWPGIFAPPFGAPRRTFLDTHSEIVRYVPLLRAALAVTGDAQTPYAAAQRLQQWFRVSGGFTYTNRPALFAEAPLVGFVVQTRSGYCQYFAGAMALMLRYLGVPARVAVGFSSGTYDRAHHRWRVTDHDAHAWVEAWFRGYGWLPFDPTPSAGRPERGTLSAPYARANASIRTPDVGPLGTPDQGSQTDFRHGEVTAPEKPRAVQVVAAHRGHPLLWFLALLVAAVLVAIVVIKFVTRRVRYVTRNPRRVAAACRQELAEYLLDQRIEGARSATLHELGELVRYELAVEPDAFVAAATAARFGRPEGSAAAARRARRELRALLRALRTRLTPRERARGLFSLRSLGFTP